MPRTSRYPGFHKHVTRIYLVIVCVIAVGLPILHITIEKPSLKNMIAIIACVITSYVVYWLIVRLNCYGTPNTLNGRNPSLDYPNRIYIQSPLSNSSTSSTNGGSSNVNNHPTFASYRLGGLVEVFRRFGGNNGASNANDDEINPEMEAAALNPPPPTYKKALEGAGLPPPYMNDQVEINIHNSEIPQMSEAPRRPVSSIPSSSSLRRLVPPIPQQSSTQSTQSTQYTPQDSFIISPPRRSVPTIPSSSLDNTSQSPRRSVPLTPSSSSLDITSQPSKRPVPPIPSSSSLDSIPQPQRHPTPPIPASSSSALPPRLYKNISYDNKE